MAYTMSIVDQVTAVAAQLSAAERLAIIRAVVVAAPPPEAYETTDQVEVERRLIAEENAWYGRPKAERMRFAGKYVAVQDGEVVDQDEDQRALVLRTRTRKGAVLIVGADRDALPTYSFPGTHLTF